MAKKKEKLGVEGVNYGNDLMRMAKMQEAENELKQIEKETNEYLDNNLDTDRR